jgi:glycosyltransferase involved in cell wall biosynthesis
VASIPLVTCVVPVYNAEKYLEQGIQSLLNQTYKNIEIILVDDCSTDKSWEICQNYADLFPNIFSFKNAENSGGPLRGRERGIKESHGEWITFMDGDDYVKDTYIENLLKTTDNGKYDIAVTGHSRLYPNGEVEDFLWEDYSQSSQDRLAIFYQHLLRHDFWTDPTDTIGQSLVRAEVCKKTDLSKYSNRIYAEDTIMALAFLENSKNGVNFVDHHDFLWRYVEGSGSNGGFSNSANQTEFYVSCLDIFHKPSNYQFISERCPLISVIIPVFNVEKYLEACLKSVTLQSYRNIEIIIVNDGSPDESQKIIDKFKKSDTRIVSIKQKNQGLNMARAAGSRVARGKFVTYIDSDDIVHSDHIKHLFENLLTNDVDVAISGFTQFKDVSEILQNTELHPNYAEQILRNRDEALRYYLWEIAGPVTVHPMTAWGKLYKKEIIEKTNWKMSNYSRHEDNFETLQWYSAAHKGVSVVSVSTYYYRLNPKSITGTQAINTNPDGKKLNYFEFIDELYEVTCKYLNSKEFASLALNQFAQTNTIQVYNFFEKGQLSEDDVRIATENWNKIQSIYTSEIKEKDSLLHQQARLFEDITNSLSWKATKPLRKMKNITKRAREALRKTLR